MALAFGQAATQAPQPMQAAASIASSAFGLWARDGVAVLGAPGAHGDEAAGLDDAVEGAAVDGEVLDDRERGGAPGLDGDLVAVLELAHVELAGGGAFCGAVGPRR
jgi:hypothetical protein